MNKVVSSLSLVVVFGLAMAPSAQAQMFDGWGNTSLKTGSGDEITIKNGLFGSKTRVVKDRLGDKYVSKRGLFGNTDKEIAVFGNSYKKKKGIFGGRETEVSTLFGDSIKSKKNLFGYRSTQIDASGMSSLIGAAIQGLSSKPMVLHEPGLGATSQGGLAIPPEGTPGLSPLVNPQDAPLDAVPQSLDGQVQ
ncbi:MAG: hypothetical protein SGJ27_01110 [Candidatus Melainabacteria bacterium]|nr:hypothetical protein [Candidatus Melainabacteria bacterium]